MSIDVCEALIIAFSPGVVTFGHVLAVKSKVESIGVSMLPLPLELLMCFLLYIVPWVNALFSDCDTLYNTLMNSVIVLNFSFLITLISEERLFSLSLKLAMHINL